LPEVNYSSQTTNKVEETELDLPTGTESTPDEELKKQ
jgi:hypothetical protein